MKTTELLAEIKACTFCANQLPLGPRPVVNFHKNSKIIIIGQAPGQKVHNSGVPWDDQSGKLLRKWLNVDEETFYNPEKIAIVPMGFCYPGKGKSGDLPPRPECAEKWHRLVLNNLPNAELTLLIGQYSQNYYLADRRKSNLTETVKQYKLYQPTFFPLPHPSPRNRIWLRKNSWFEEQVIPVLQAKVAELIHH